MRAVIQRVSQASVFVDGVAVGRIGPGLVVLLAVQEGDGPEDAAYVQRKILNLRVFDDAQGRMNLSLLDSGGALLVVSQFTLLGDCRKGNRPSYSKAAPPEAARRVYEDFVNALQGRGVEVASGQFQAAMSLTLANQGPVTLILDSRWRRAAAQEEE